ncbi:hypothetical protein GI584_00225 [Gracilibacillus salitolerans]|uniref:Uncharacterized protein n=1 Tax=Gracilibacillus salitolerans TaxID=2663022 RepID=A0A5Q2TDD0_9BACI|nr:hypothetical protein [Gracilibacillus salitolerans]QGH32605.1 hypothetical protein GI584_00225 [Gracilibacillus salitolerans]
MLLRLDQSETALLLAHMAMTRKSARNTFKRNHKNEKKELLQSFDEVKDCLEEVIENTNEEVRDQVNNFHFNVREVKMIHSFLSSYIPLLSETIKKAGAKEGDKEQIKALEKIKEYSHKLLEGASVV